MIATDEPKYDHVEWNRLFDKQDGNYFNIVKFWQGEKVSEQRMKTIPLRKLLANLSTTGVR